MGPTVRPPLTRATAGRVLLLGPPVDGGLTRSLERGFVQVGWDVALVATADPRPRILASAAWRWPELAIPVRGALRRQVESAAGSDDVDLVLIVKGPFVTPTFVTWLRRRFRAPVVCWNPDNPFDAALSNRGGGIPLAIGAYDLYVTWADDVAEQLSVRRDDVAVIPFGWDPVEHHPDTGPTPAAGRVVFIGSWDPEREAAMRSIAGLRPLVIGSMWPPLPGVEVRPPVVGGEFRAAMCGARWSVNLLRPQNRRSHNMRTFEILGCGGNEVAPRTPDHERWLARLGVPLFDSIRDLSDLLTSEPPARSPLADDWLAGQTYAHRVTQLLDVLAL